MSAACDNITQCCCTPMHPFSPATHLFTVIGPIFQLIHWTQVLLIFSLSPSCTFHSSHQRERGALCLTYQENKFVNSNKLKYLKHAFWRIYYICKTIIIVIFFPLINIVIFISFTQLIKDKLQVLIFNEDNFEVSKRN